MSTSKFLGLAALIVLICLAIAALGGLVLDHFLVYHVRHEAIAAICGMWGIVVGAVAMFVLAFIIDKFER